MIKSLTLCLLLSACSKSSAGPTPQSPPPDPLPAKNLRPGSLGIIGDSTDVKPVVSGGIVLMGGSTDVDPAFKWMIDRSGGGDVVVIRASGTDAYNPFINALGKVNSVETLKIDSRALADNDTVAAIIRNAEMLFIAGGDQSNYMNFWKGTKTEAAINYLLNEKGAPVGGTSAGCAILGGFYYSGEQGSAVSEETLKNPYHPSVTLYNNDFLNPPFLAEVITDQHYLARSREGRSVVFLSRIFKDWNKAAKAIAVDERTAVCIDRDGKASVLGLSSSSRPYSYAYFIVSESTKAPERVEPGAALNWNREGKALAVYEIKASADGSSASFDVKTFDFAKASGGTKYWWWVDNGELKKNAN